MTKLLMLSVVIAMTALPLIAAFDPSRRGLTRAVIWTLGLNVLYVLAILFVVPFLH